MNMKKCLLLKDVLNFIDSSNKNLIGLFCYLFIEQSFERFVDKFYSIISTIIHSVEYFHNSWMKCIHSEVKTALLFVKARENLVAGNLLTVKSVQ